MRHNFFPAIAFSALAAIITPSCSEDKSYEIKPDEEPTRKKTILLYAVASNNLYSNLINDKHEMQLAAQNIDLNHYSMLVYEVVPNSQEYGDTPRLLELTRNSAGETEFVELKRYDRSIYSTDPERISQVIEDMQTLREADSYGLILWSHALGWSPFFSERDTRAEFPSVTTSAAGSNLSYTLEYGGDLPMNYSFGSDTNSQTGYTDKIDIDELAGAIPDHLFEFIWFDACMMSGIETIYEMRDKCDYFGGYPTEVFAPGMPYDLTLPYLLREKADMKGCAIEFFNYYAQNKYAQLRTATVAVIDMSELEPMADFCKRRYAGSKDAATYGLDYYSGNQRVAYKYYDFGQYTLARGSENEDDASEEEFRRLLDKLVVYRNATETEFTGKKLNLDEYSGISSHAYSDSQTGKAADYYRSLDWFKRVY